MKECIEDLAQAIILQAILEYREALKTLENDRKRKRKQKARQRERRKKQKGTPDTPLQKKIDGKERKDTETHTCRAKRIRRARRMKRDVEEFFRSNWYRMISDPIAMKAIVLHDIEHLSGEETAEIMRCSRTQIYRLRDAGYAELEKIL